MVDEVITKQELIDAQKDAQSLDDFINGGDEQIVITRLLKEYPTLANAIRQIYEKGGKFYPTLAAANADIANIRTDVYVITGDNGAYYKATAGATSLTKSPYDPIEQAKVDATTKANAAKSEAIAAASSDATTKANAAQQAAAVDATTKAITAEANAKNYTDLSVQQLVSSHTSSILVNTGKLYEANSVNYDTSDFIPVQPEDIITVTSQIYGITEICRFYRLDRTVLSSANNPTTINGVFTTSVTVPSNAAFVKIASANSSRSGYIPYTFSATVSRLKTNAVKIELNKEIEKTNNSLTLVKSGNSVVYDSSYFLFSTPNYNEAVALKTYGATKLYTLLHSAGSVDRIKATKADGSVVVLNSASTGSTVDVFNNIIDLPEGTISVTLRTASETNVSYREGLSPIAVIANNEQDIINALNKHYSSQPYAGFAQKNKHNTTASSTYDSTLFMPMVKGNVLSYSVDGTSSYGLIYKKDGTTQSVGNRAGVITLDDFSYVILSTYNTGNANYNPSFNPNYQRYNSVVEYNATKRQTKAKEVFSEYLPTPTLKTIREVTFIDGTDKQATQYLWQDGDNNFYISSSKDGDKKYIFTYYAENFYGYEPHAFSMGFDKYGNILCVFRIEILSSTTPSSDSNRRNPILLVKSQNYEPVTIDFGSGVKPSGWLQNCGFLCTDYAIFITEYTRPTVETANTWKATYPISNPENWKKVQTFAVTPDFKHIHNVDRDPYTGYIYTSTGDGDSAAAIYVSTDNGETFTSILSGMEKYCRLLNWVFTKDWVYWATDSTSSIHFLFKAPRNASKIIDVSNITEVKFPAAAAPTYATIYMKKLDLLVFLGRHDGNSATITVDAWDIKNDHFVLLDTIPSVNGTPTTLGFRCECFEYIPRGNEIMCGYSRTVGVGGYLNSLGILGNTTDVQKKVNNIKLTVDRIGDEFSINYSTVVL